RDFNRNVLTRHEHMLNGCTRMTDVVNNAKRDVFQKNSSFDPNYAAQKRVLCKEESRDIGNLDLHYQNNSEILIWFLSRRCCMVIRGTSVQVSKLLLIK